MIRSSVTKHRRPILAILGLALLLFGRPATVAAAGSGPSGLPLPRFVSILGDKVNLRSGPGVRYPVAWVFVRANLPVLVTLEFENWRKVRN